MLPKILKSFFSILLICQRNNNANFHSFICFVLTQIYLQRMDSYYKRNYKDYFEFEEGTIRAKKGELTKSEKGILDWLENNK